ncbi:MAG: hypothetical protein IH843_06135 [Thaumarchaeota archaeon]|nr:hypothetical protein [Nitrososphaerota archaeon]
MSVGKKTLEALAMSSKIIGNAVKHTGKAFHWAKPGLDRIVDSSATILLGNAAVSEGLYRGGKFLVDNGIDILDGDVAKGATYALAFAGANIGKKIRNAKIGILPLAWKALTKKKKRGIKSYIKTVALVGATAATLNYGQVTSDAKHVYNEFVRPQIIENTELHEGLSDFATSLSDFLTDLPRYLVPKEKSAKLERTIEENERISKAYSEGFNGRVTKDARKISDRGYPITPEQLAYLTRLTYFEAIFEK